MQVIFPDLQAFSFRQLGLIGVGIFAFFGWLSTAGLSLGAIVLVFGILLNIASFWRSMRRQPMFWLSLLAIGFILLHWLLQAPLDEQTARYAERYTTGLIYLWLFPFIAWYLSGRQEMARWLVGLAAVGLCIQVLRVTDWHHFSDFMKQRQDFGFSWTGAALHCALSVWGLVFLSTFVYRNYSGWLKWSVVIVGSLGIILLSEALIITQSRSAWGALLMAVVIVGLLFAVKERRTIKNINKKKLFITAVMISALVGALLTANITKLSNRIMAESNSYKALLSFDRTQIPYTSVGVRGHMLLYGLELWRSKPLWGWGVGSSRSLLAMDDLMGRYDHPHFHNNYIELLVEQGVFGFLLYCVAFLILMRGLFKAYIEGRVARDIFYYLIGGWVMILVWSITDTRMVHADVRFVLLFLSGMSFSVMLTRDEQSLDDYRHV
jgi:O-antigen ligase